MCQTIQKKLSYANNQSIVVGLLDKETFELTKVREYDGRYYEHMQQLSLVNGVPTLSWIESVVKDERTIVASSNNAIVSA